MEDEEPNLHPYNNRTAPDVWGGRPKSDCPECINIGQPILVAIITDGGQ